ncbi:hypothetical protein LY78DRAFT_685080 [Colletotrichum sublineola]|nr:hypothetical protein LY78DRAFT_685080 [Colletotrichum sublineola]
MSTISSNANTVQGPTPEQWDEVRTHMHQIYIVEGQPLKVVISRMESEHAFRATTKMYNTYFEKWKPFFNKKKTRNRGAATEHATRVSRTRPRRLQSHAQPSSNIRPRAPILPMLSLDPLLCHGYTMHSAVIRSTKVCQFSGTMFDVVVPHGQPDNTATWQQIADECFGASVLVVKGEYRDGFATFNRACQRLKDVVGNHDCSMVIKLWRFWKPVTFRPFHCLRERLGPQNAVVLSTWSNYSKTYTRQRLPADELLSGYRHVLQEAEKAYTSLGTRTIEILYGYMYAAYYNAGDHVTTRVLALELVDRVEYRLRTWDHPEWCLVVQGYALAVKLLYVMSRSTHPEEQDATTLRLAISIFQRGDRECQTRAVMLRGILDHGN